MVMTRRAFLADTLKNAGLALCLMQTPVGLRIAVAKERLDAWLNAWVRVTADGIVTLRVNKTEMGQGVHTALAQILMDELEADPALVRIEMAPARIEYWDPVWCAFLTGESTSVRHMHDLLRKMAATAREMLISAASKQWGVDRVSCRAQNGTIVHVPTGKRLGYGELAQKAASIEIPQDPPLKPKEERRLIGQPLPRVDIPAKVAGSAKFGIDHFMEGMLYSSLARPEALGGKVLSYDKEAALHVPYVRGVVKLEHGVAVVAETLEAAWNGKNALKARFDPGRYPDLDTEAIEAALLSCLKRKGKVALSRGSIEEGLQNASKTFRAAYYLPYVAHVTMEPMSCLVHIQKDRADIFAPTQNPSSVLAVAKWHLGLDEKKIHVHVTLAGGGFGRRLSSDFIEEAILIAKQVKRPIKLVWTREEDFQNDIFRPGCASEVLGGLDENGRLIAWHHRVAVPSLYLRLSPHRYQRGIDHAGVDGIVTTPYNVPNFLVEYIRVETPDIPCGYFRSVGNSHNAFVVESFIDEMAHLARRDPVSFRLELLKANPRVSSLIEMTAERAGFGRSPREGHSLGFAYHGSFDAHVAQVAEISTDDKTGRIRVHKVFCGVDCGPVINPDTVKAQMEGSIIMGISTALKERVAFKRGGVENKNFNTYPILRMSETPKIEVFIKENPMAKIGGVGEPGLPPAIPAVTNAFFAATGRRIRKLPIELGQS
jgi:isoquinoline 1-oxidoreductase beta subunit